MIGQPKDYSEMLKRIFMASLIVKEIKGSGLNI
jgi:hypothetical protein